MSASGGEENTYSIGGVNYKSHTFLTSGNFVVTESGTVGTVDILVVGGGGAGAKNNYVGSGGGGGGVETSIAYSVTAATYTATIGNGGAYFTSGYGGNPGDDSVFATSANTTIVSGLGGNKPDGDASCNPSGNGYTCGTQPDNYIGSGGGGASAVGVDGVGGAGIESLFRSGTSVFYGGGGGGGISSQPVQSGGSGGGGDSLQNGDINTGGGGGGGSQHANTYAGSGGSGIVIVRYAI
jgi:hypothetical protein